MTQNIAWPLIGHVDAEQDFLSAHDRGRLHHAWLIEGPSGIGKSLLARRFSAFLLGARGTDISPLDAGPDDPIIQKLNAEAHPDLRWLARRPDDKGKVKQDIPVDDVRALNNFFSLKSAQGGWRIGVIDALDELNRSGANALLKTLEEPPKNVVIFLISHGVRPVLPTIRSRCRRLRLTRLDDVETNAVLGTLDDERAKMAQLIAHGRPGYGLELATSNGLIAARAAQALTAALPKPADAIVTDAILRAGADPAAFEAFASEILAWLAMNASSNPAYADVWLTASRLTAETHDMNMDRTQAAAKLVSELHASAVAS